MKRRKNDNIYENAKPILLSALFVLVAFLAWNYLIDKDPGVEKSECEFHFIDVGQGDCTLACSSDSAVLVDAGPGDASSETVSYIRSYTDHIDYFVLTHPDEDHIGGAAEIISRLKVKNIIMSDASKGTATFTKLLDAIEQSDAKVIRASAGNVYVSGGIKLEILGPVDEFDGNYNDYSVVSRISYGDVSAIITGDAETSSEGKMVKEYCDDERGINGLEANILKLGHHGSSTSSSKKFVKSVAPQYAVISCGKDNSYGHPHRETLALLDELSIEYYRTDTKGTIVFETDGEGLRLK